MNSIPEQERLFFALWPDDAVRAELAARSRALVPAGVRATATPNLHMTLVFLGSCDSERRQCLEGAADNIHSAAFSLTLDCNGHFPRPQVYWLGVSNPPAALLALVQALRDGQSSCGMTPEPRAFRPHVTLARKVRTRPPDVACQPLRWQVDRFVLVRSQTLPSGPVYEPQRTWMLHGK